MTKERPHFRDCSPSHYGKGLGVRSHTSFATPSQLTFQMNILRLARQQLRIGLTRNLASQPQVKVDRILRRRRRYIHPLRPSLTRDALRHSEQPRAQSPLSIRAAHVQELELESISVLADTLVVEDDHSNDRVALEQTMEPSAAIEAFEQDRRIFLRLARRPSARVDVM